MGEKEKVGKMEEAGKMGMVSEVEEVEEVFRCGRGRGFNPAKFPQVKVMEECNNHRQPRQTIPGRVILLFNMLNYFTLV